MKKIILTCKRAASGLLITLTTLFISAHIVSAQTTIANWTFETSAPAGAPGAGAWITNIAAEVGTGTASGKHAGAATYSSPSGNGTAHSFSANTWATGDFFQFSVATTGNTNIQVDFDQTGSSTGPRDFNFSYSTDGVNFTIVGSTYVVLLSTWSPTAGVQTQFHYSYDLSSITALNNASVVYFRLIDTSTTSVGGGTVATAGTDRVDNFAVLANNPAPVSISADPQNTTANVWTTPSLSVTASGPLPQYRWYKDGSPINDGGNVYGTTSSAITFSNVLHANAGVYKVVVSNSINSVTSAPATLSVVGFAIAADRTNTLSGVAVGASFSFVDNQTPITTASGTSGNQNLLPDANVVVTGSGNSRTATLSPVAGSNGVAVVTVTASDGTFTTNASFPLVVVPNTSVLLNDFFEYPDGSLIPNSANLWQNYGGTAGDLQVVSGQLYLSRAASEDGNALLIGQPYATNSGVTLYSKFTVNFNASDTPTSTGTYLAHFKDDAFGYRCRLWTFTNAVGQLRLAIGNSSDSTAANVAQFPLDLQYSTAYTVVTRLVLSNNISTLWIDPTSESDTHATATDVVTNVVGVTSYAFRQASGMSKLFVDDVVVGTSFAAVTGGVVAPTPIPLNYQHIGTNLVLSWSDPTFLLQSAPLVTGTYTNIPSATSPYTNAISGSEKYFRLINTN